MQNKTKEAAAIICRSKLSLALTGAGISVESGIPDFRSTDGLWARYDPMEYGTISAFRRNPQKVWDMVAEMSALMNNARPNTAHVGLARLQQLGLLHTIITQNVDNLHQAGGATRVIEFHGNSSSLICLWCGERYRSQSLSGKMPPKCDCGRILKPEVVFFGEPIPSAALAESSRLAAACEALLVVGTSAEVSPANTIPAMAKSAGAKIIEINLNPTVLTESLTDLFLPGKATEMVSQLVEAVEEAIPPSRDGHLHP
ncbi:MAG: NAD-dependent deacylase [Deltaproteobacteria bacterium]|nr:NAD-dependent deacylase [Deltaproteobacteria bacterium]MBW2071940.1 NAD-dependent deacylase [Deltaproteobacteria bacterium]